ncbi:MAG: M28 family peptidase [Bacteroidales bacterium]|jgi:hypothetical protein|nr:M28 family peptidase [Bacteroidales bacterium]
MHSLIKAIFVFLLLQLSAVASAQTSGLAHYSNSINKESIERSLSFISDDLTKGRLTGTPGSMIVSSYLRDEFKRMGMIPFYSSTFTQSFPVNNLSTSEKITGRNIIGVIPSLYYTDEYILISAHYDHLGIIGGRVYNGADDNASGVSALLSIAETFSTMRLSREGPRKNIIFALFDAKEGNMAGSEYFSKNLPISSSKISYNINIDQIGCTFTPPGSSDNYLLYVADARIRGTIKNALETLNRFYDLDMDIDHTFYDSPSFYDIFLRTSDQYNLSKAGIPSMLFTSGIHMHTYKHTDVKYFINYPVLVNRTRLLFLLTNYLIGNR